MKVFRHQIITQITEIWQQSPTLIIFWRYMCRFFEVEAMEGGWGRFRPCTLWLYSLYWMYVVIIMLWLWLTIFLLNFLIMAVLNYISMINILLASHIKFILLIMLGKKEIKFIFILFKKKTIRKINYNKYYFHKHECYSI